MSNTNLVRVTARAFEDVDLYAAIMQDVEYMLKNNGRRVPPNNSRILVEQKKLNDYLRYIMVDFIQKNFNITIPDGTPIGVIPQTEQNDAMVTLSSGYKQLVRNAIEPTYVSDIFVSGSVTVNVSATEVTKAATNLKVTQSTVQIPGFTIPEIQKMLLDENDEFYIGEVYPSMQVAPVSFKIPKITFNTADLGNAVLTITVYEDDVQLFEESHQVGVGTETFSFFYALPEREIGSHVYLLQARLVDGQGSIPIGGGKLQVWANAEITKAEG